MQSSRAKHSTGTNNSGQLHHKVLGAEMDFLLAVDGSTLTRGLAIAISGLAIVFLALALISLFIASLPRVLQSLNRFWPATDEPHSRETHPKSQVADDEHILAAIGFVLHTELVALEQERSDEK